MDFFVSRTNQTLIKPSDQTPSEILDLSAIDCLPGLRCNVRTLHVFKHGEQPSMLIKKALSKALVSYYPLAGRIKEMGQGKISIECSSEFGVWFVEANANCGLDDVSYFENVASIPYEHLIPLQDHGLEPLVQMQVTEFACGGFVIGLIFCHSICDGLGAAQFLTAVGDLARGHKNPQIQPIWSRHFFPFHNPNHNPSPKPPPILPNYQLHHSNIDISLQQIKNLKIQYQTTTAKTCSVFELAAAIFWIRRTRAIGFNPNTELTLIFFANCRKLVDPPLPDGFYGNCFFPVTVKTSSGFLMGNSFAHVVNLIQKAKDELREEFGKYVNGELLADPFTPEIGYTTLFMSEWGRLGFNEVDYGWGKAVQIVPIQGSGVMPVGILGSLPAPEKGVRLMTWCVNEEHLQRFVDQVIE